MFYLKRMMSIMSIYVSADRFETKDCANFLILSRTIEIPLSSEAFNSIILERYSGLFKKSHHLF